MAYAHIQRQHDIGESIRMFTIAKRMDLSTLVFEYDTSVFKKYKFIFLIIYMSLLWAGISTFQHFVEVAEGL